MDNNNNNSNADSGMKKFTDVFNTEVDRVDGEWEIESIVSLSLDEPEELYNSDEVYENITFDANIPQDIKRGEIMWVTAFIKKKGNTTYNSSSRQAVIKVRVVDIYFGYNYLNKMNKK